MRPAIVALCVTMAACVSPAAAPGTQAALAQLQAAAVPGATRAGVIAAVGATTRVQFDSGAEVWHYLTPAGSGRFDEFIILFGPDGKVRKTRTRAPHPLDPP